MSGYARNMASFRIVSADAHVLEPPHIWETWLPKALQDNAPKLAKDIDGGDAWLFAGSPDPDPIGLVTTPGMPWDQFRWTGVTYEQARPGCYDGSARLVDMDIDGVDAEILFPPQRTIGHFLGDEDDDFVRAGVDAYNNFLWEEFCAPDRGRLVGMAQIGSTGVDDAVDTLRKARARGFKGVVISCWPSGERRHLRRRRSVLGGGRGRADARVHPHQPHQPRFTAAHARRTGQGGEGQQSALRRARRQKSKANAKAVGGLAGVFATVPGTIGQLIFTGCVRALPEPARSR